MAESEAITIPLRLPSDEALALAQLAKRVGYEDCVRLSSRFDRYDGRAECDVMWSAMHMLRAALGRSRLRAPMTGGDDAGTHSARSSRGEPHHHFRVADSRRRRGRDRQDDTGAPPAVSPNVVAGRECDQTGHTAANALSAPR